MTKRRLEIVGQDTNEGFILKLNLTGFTLPKRPPYLWMRVEAKEFRTAISCLPDSNGLKLRFFQDRIEICSPGNEGTVFNVRSMLAKPILSTEVRYDNRLVLPAHAILLLTRASRVFPDIIRITFSNKSLQVFELPPSQRKLLSVSIHGGKGRKAEVVVASRHFRRISEILRKSSAQDTMVSVDYERPLRLAFRVSKYSSILAVFPREHDDDSNASQASSVQTLPVFKTCPIVQLISFIGSRASGIDPLLITRAGLDTSSSLNLLLAQTIGLVSWTNSVIMLTDEGRRFLGLLRGETGAAKIFLHDLALGKIPLYRKVLSNLTTSPMPFDELKSAVTHFPGNEKSQDLGETIAILIGIASWCGIVTRKLGLIYSLKTQMMPKQGSSKVPA